MKKIFLLLPCIAFAISANNPQNESGKNNKFMKGKPNIETQKNKCKCVNLNDIALKHCMNNIENNEEYIANIEKLNSPQKEIYLKEALIKKNDYKLFFSRFSPEEWKSFYKSLSPEFQILLPKNVFERSEFLDQFDKTGWKEKALYTTGGALGGVIVGRVVVFVCVAQPQMALAIALSAALNKEPQLNLPTQQGEICHKQEQA